MPYSGCVPAKVTVPSAGARTDVRGCALISMPPWNSVTRVHGERRLPNSELTEPRTGQRDGSAATALPARAIKRSRARSEEHTSELQSLTNLVCRLLLEKKKKNNQQNK